LLAVAGERDPDDQATVVVVVADETVVTRIGNDNEFFAAGDTFRTLQTHTVAIRVDRRHPFDVVGSSADDLWRPQEDC